MARSIVIEALHRDIITEIIITVARFLVSDLFNCKLCCKALEEIGKKDYILHGVNIKGCVNTRRWFRTNQEDGIGVYFRLCLRCDNSGTLFIQGMLSFLTHFSTSEEYFLQMQTQQGIFRLEKATSLGHTTADSAFLRHGRNHTSFVSPSLLESASPFRLRLRHEYLRAGASKSGMEPMGEGEEEPASLQIDYRKQESAPQRPPEFDPSRMIGIIRRKALIKDLAAVYHAECLAYCQELLELQTKWEETYSHNLASEDVRKSTKRPNKRAKKA